jgi:hypothetical protein
MQKDNFQCGALTDKEWKRQREEDRGSSRERPYGYISEWNLIWHSLAPPKVKTFAWKLARDGLATTANMVRRKMINDSTCPIYGAGEEDIFHALVTCPQAHNLWGAMKQCWNIPSVKELYRNGKDWNLPLLNFC